MENYKILNSDANQIVKLLNELGYTWTPATNDSETSLLKAYWIIAESSGELVYSSTESFIDEDSYKEISLAQLNDLVAQSKNEQGLISGADALRALADGEEVEVRFKENIGAGWYSSETLKRMSVEKITDGNIELRLKPRTITLNLEIPAPFEPKVGDKLFYLDNAEECGYMQCTYSWGFDPKKLNFGCWDNECKVRQVVAVLRGAICKK